MYTMKWKIEAFDFPGATLIGQKIHLSCKHRSQLIISLSQRLVRLLLSIPILETLTADGGERRRLSSGFVGHFAGEQASGHFQPRREPLRHRPPSGGGGRQPEQRQVQRPRSPRRPRLPPTWQWHLHAPPPRSPTCSSQTLSGRVRGVPPLAWPQVPRFLPNSLRNSGSLWISIEFEFDFSRMYHSSITVLFVCVFFFPFLRRLKLIGKLEGIKMYLINRFVWRFFRRMF